MSADILLADAGLSVVPPAPNRLGAAAQQPNWPDPHALAAATARLRSLPPLVFAGECDLLAERLAQVARGEAFVLMGGDCAETFAGATADAIRAKLKTVLQMAIVLTYGASLPVVKIGRLAGQFGKPRSSDTETIDGVVLPSYRGDAVNDAAATLAARIPDPARLVQAYHTASATLNLVRAFTQGGYADLHHVHSWNQDWVASTEAGHRYDAMAGEIDRALAFLKACGADPAEFRRVEFFAGHEALLLDYEDAMTRIDSRTDRPYDVSAHFLWIGERTRQLDGAHVEFAANIRNPVGVKLGPNTTAAEAIGLAEELNPQRVPGRLTLITRMGADKVREKLGPIVRAVTDSGHPVVWVCDPMHGNTFTTANGVKTRSYADVMDEVIGFFEVMRGLDVHPGGLHVELTGDDVTECVGGTAGVTEEGLGVRYETACDPRLNRVQSLELAFSVAEMLVRR